MLLRIVAYHLPVTCVIRQDIFRSSAPGEVNRAEASMTPEVVDETVEGEEERLTITRIDLDIITTIIMGARCRDSPDRPWLLLRMKITVVIIVIV